MQRKIVLLTTVMLFAGVVSACAGQEPAVPEVDHDAQVTFAVETVYAQIAMTSAAAEAMATPTPAPTNTPEPTLTPTMAPTETPTNVFADAPTDTPAAAAALGGNTAPLQPAQPQDVGLPCHRANLEGETIPDGTEMAPERQFVKIWRLKNTGSCTWNRDYILRFYNGDLLGAGASIVLTEEEVPTWGFVEVAVDMVAPDEIGTYKGYWKIVSDSGKIFGVGPDGKGWIWVEIKVIE